jgi:hypothetical protein
VRGSLELEGTLVRYLLGELSGPERAEIERRLLTEDGFEDEIQAAVDDLLQAYLQGTLSGEERRKVEAHLLSSPYHRERLVLVKDMLAAADRVSASEAAPAVWSRRRSWALAAMLAVVVAGVIIFLLSARAPEAPRRAGSLPPVPTSSPLTPKPEPSTTASPDTSREASVLHLPPDANATVEVSIPGQSQALRVVVPLAASRPSFDAVLRNAAGREVWRVENLLRSKAERAIVFTIPAGVLAAADYTLFVQSEAMRDDEAPPRVKLEYRLRVRKP